MSGRKLLDPTAYFYYQPLHTHPRLHLAPRQKAQENLLAESQTEVYEPANVEVNKWRCSSTDFCGARAYLKPGAPCVRFLDHTHLDTSTHPVALLWMSDQPFATYATGRRRTYNVTLRRVPITIAAVEKQ